MKTSNQKTQKQAVKTTRARRPRKLAGKRIIAKAGEQKGYLTVRQVAAKLDVTLATVQVWIRNGEFPGAKRSRNGWSLLVPEKALNAFVAKRAA
jgi:excisionase family DNA binding protein